MSSSAVDDDMERGLLSDAIKNAYLHIDVYKMEQVIRNLITNAVSYFL